MFENMEILTLALIPAFLLLDLVWRARRYETTRFWRLRGLKTHLKENNHVS